MKNSTINNKITVLFLKGIRNMFCVLFISFSSLLIGGCNDNPPPKDEHVEAEHQHDESTSEVKINAMQFKQLNISFSDIEKRSMTATLKTTGSLKVPPQNKANITSALGGTVNAISVKEGDHVNKGQVLLTLHNPEFIKLQQEFLDAQSQLIFAEADYNRQKELSEKNITARKTFQLATSNYSSLKAKVSSITTQLSLLGVNSSQLTSEHLENAISIKSPVKGSISHIDVNIGSTVDPSKIMMDVVDNTQLHLDMFVFEQDLSKIKEGLPVEIWLTNLPGKHYHAKIFAIGSAFEGNSKSIPVHATITGDKKGLIEGMNVTAMISTDSNFSMVVPTSAIIGFGGNDYVFIQSRGDDEHKHADGETHEHAEVDSPADSTAVFHFMRIAVKKGVSHDGFSEITPLEELDPKAKVISNGAYYLNAMLTNAGEEGHHH